jgi:hypothetical protein
MIGTVLWQPFALALVLGLVISAGLYFAYMWPSVAPDPSDDRKDVGAEAAPSSQPSEPTT